MIEKKREQELYEETSRRLRELLSERNMKAIELAELSGVNRSNISQYVNGVHVPNTTTAYKMAQVLRCNPAYLMGFDVNPHSSIEAAEYTFEAPKGTVTLSSHDYTVEDLKGLSFTIEANNEDKGRDKRLLAYMTKLYDAYQKAPKNVQDAVRTLLNGDNNNESS